MTLLIWSLFMLIYFSFLDFIIIFNFINYKVLITKQIFEKKIQTCTKGCLQILISQSRTVNCWCWKSQNRHILFDPSGWYQQDIPTENCHKTSIFTLFTRVCGWSSSVSLWSWELEDQYLSCSYDHSLQNPD